MYFVLKGCVRVRVGSMDELDRKLTLVARVLQDKSESGGIPEGMPSLIDVSDPARVIHRASPDIEMPFWAE